MRLAKTVIAAVFALGALGARADTITPIAPDQTWNQFYFGDTGSTFLDDFAFNGPGQLSFSVSLSGPARLSVADGGLAGDVFAVYDNGSLLGATSTPTGTLADDTGVDFDAALASSKWSHGQWTLGAGAHVITGIVSVSALGAGVGAVQLAPVPEPETFALFLSGLGLLGLYARRRA